MAQQMGLFGAVARTFCAGDRGGIVYYPGVVAPAEAQQLFAHFERSIDWVQETMWMYDRTVDVPRLIARFPAEAGLPPEVPGLKARVEQYLQTHFNAVSLQYYRNGSDSVAWHNDSRGELVERPTIALLSLGATRQMQIRSKARPRETFAIDLEVGSLLVMSGRSQEFWEHAVPKSSRPVGPRISVALRQRVTKPAACCLTSTACSCAGMSLGFGTGVPSCSIAKHLFIARHTADRPAIR